MLNPERSRRCCREGAGYGEAQHVQYDLYPLPLRGFYQPYNRVRYDGVPRDVEELVVAPASVDDLGGDGDEHEGGEEMGYLVIERDRLENFLGFPDGCLLDPVFRLSTSMSRAVSGITASGSKASVAGSKPVSPVAAPWRD